MVKWHAGVKIWLTHVRTRVADTLATNLVVRFVNKNILLVMINLVTSLPWEEGAVAHLNIASMLCTCWSCPLLPPPPPGVLGKQGLILRPHVPFGDRMGYRKGSACTWWGRVHVRSVLVGTCVWAGHMFPCTKNADPADCSPNRT